MEKEKVIMFVWNYFTNDARVYKECLTIEELGFDVELIAISSQKEEKSYLKLPRCKINRVKSNLPKIIGYPVALGKIMEQIIKKNKWFLFLIIITSLVLFFLKSKILGVLLTIALLAPYKLLGAVGYKFFIFFRMMVEGIQSKGDIVHANDLNTLLQAVLVAKVFTKKKKKLIYDSHEVQISRTGYNSIFYYYFEKNLIKHCDIIIQENETRSQFFLSVYGLETEVLHNYPLSSTPEKHVSFDLRARYNISPKTKIMIYQGGVQIGRGLEQLIESMKFMRNLDVVLIIVGEGKIRSRLMDLVEKLELESSVIFTGRVELMELPMYTVQADVGFQLLENVCYNHYSAASNKLFEYIMALTPVIGVNFPEIKTIIASNDIGIVLEKNNAHEIFKAVSEIFSSKETYKDQVNNCRATRNKYVWENEKKIIEKIYLKISDKEY